MNIDLLLETDLPIIYAYTATEVARKKILEGHSFLKVVDEQEHFLGLITAKDIFRHPYELIVDCLVDKPALRPQHSIFEATQIMIQRQEDVAPVFSESGVFLGVIQKDTLLEYLLRYSIHLETKINSNQLPL